MVGTLIGTGKEEVGIGMGAVDAECALGDDVLHLLRMSMMDEERREGNTSIKLNHEPCSIVIQRDRRDDGPETQTIVPTGDTIHSHQKTHVHHVCICLGLNRRQLRCIIIDDAVVVHNIRASASALLPGERVLARVPAVLFFGATNATWNIHK